MTIPLEYRQRSRTGFRIFRLSSEVLSVSAYGRGRREDYMFPLVELSGDHSRISARPWSNLANPVRHGIFLIFVVNLVGLVIPTDAVVVEYITLGIVGLAVIEVLVWLIPIEIVRFSDRAGRTAFDLVFDPSFGARRRSAFDDFVIALESRIREVHGRA
jgi:hypothetical protein